MTDKPDLSDYKKKTATTLKSSIRWAHELVFQGRTQRGYELDFDASMEWGLAPTESLLMSFGGCMAIDIVSILKKQRVEISSFTMEMEAERNPEPPQYFTAVKFVLKLAGSGIDRPKVDRAVNLSLEKYCSVRHSLRPDMKVTVETLIEETKE